MNSLLKQLIILCVFLIYSSIQAQNLLDAHLNNWTLGSGSVTGFNQNGSSSENTREYGEGPFGNNVILWKASPDASSNADGGWNTNYHNVDHTKTYRFTVWMKKTNSNNGYSYFGCNSYNNILKLNGSVENNPYFWYGDLPQLNKWYLLVGYVHNSSYSESVKWGGIYDPEKGIKILSLEDFKFRDGTTSLRHRSYLYYDTNINDRQFFYAPRLEQVNGNEPPISELLNLLQPTQNLYADDLLNWTYGQGSTPNFYNNGSTAENNREYGIGPRGNQVLLWKATPDAGNDADGGFNAYYKPIDRAKDYRFSVWIKKTNSNSGTTYFGLHGGTGNILTLGGTVQNNPYFWSGDLPQLNKWYLIVGYVNNSSSTQTLNRSGIYDPLTGTKVVNGTDFKFGGATVSARPRAYLYYDPNTNDRQYFYGVRMEQLNGNQPTINELLGITVPDELVFVYDAAGNQQLRRLPLPEPLLANSIAGPVLLSQEEEVGTLPEEDEPPLPGAVDDTEINSFEQSVIVFPNPTRNHINVSWDENFTYLISEIHLFDVSNRTIPVNYSPGRNSLSANLNKNAPGMYFLVFTMPDGRLITYKIIKE